MKNNTKILTVPHFGITSELASSVHYNLHDVLLSREEKLKLPDALVSSSLSFEEAYYFSSENLAEKCLSVIRGLG